MGRGKETEQVGAAWADGGVWGGGGGRWRDRGGGRGGGRLILQERGPRYRSTYLRLSIRLELMGVTQPNLKTNFLENLTRKVTLKCFLSAGHCVKHFTNNASFSGHCNPVRSQRPIIQMGKVLLRDVKHS